MPIGICRWAIHVTMGTATIVLPMTATTSTTAAARIDSSALPTLLHTMVQAPSMRVMLFPGKSVIVPLAGLT